jgi:hypothetical protein
MSRESTRVDFGQLRLKKKFIIKNQKDIVLTIFKKKKTINGFFIRSSWVNPCFIF